MTPGDRITVAEAAEILDASPRQVHRYLKAGRLPAGPRHQPRRLSRTDVEALACEVLRLRQGLSYWVTGQEAADVLGVSSSRLGQLTLRGSLPFLVHASGIRLYRRDQLAVIGNARASRRLATSAPAQAAPEVRC